MNGRRAPSATVELSTGLGASADRVWEAVKRIDTFARVARPVLGLTNLERFPTPLQAGVDVTARLLLLGVVPAWRHRLEFVRVDDRRREMLTRERGGPIRRWGHLIRVEPLPAGRCRYTDRVEIEAGLLTGAVRLFAEVFYRHRQARWRRLAATLEGGAGGLAGGGNVGRAPNPAPVRQGAR